MIKINDTYLLDNAVKEDRVVYDIHVSNARYEHESIQSILSKIIEGERDGVEIHRMRLRGADREADFVLDREINYTPTRDVLTDDDITDFDDITKTRKNGLQKAYDSFDRGYVGHQEDFIELPMNETNFLITAQDALNILPSLMNEDISVSDKIKLSNDGRSLMWQDFVMEDYTRDENPYPSRADIELYESLNPYEKRLVRSTKVHPLSILQDIKDIRSENPHATFTKEMYDKILSTVTFDHEGGAHKGPRPNGRGLVSPLYNVEQKDPEIYAYAKAKFEEKLSRAPRVLPEILSAIYKGNENRITKEAVDKYIDFYAPQGTDKRDAGRSFQASVSKVAGTRSETLLLAAGYMNFAEVSSDVIEMMNVYMTPEKIKIFGDHHFFDWYKTHRDISINEMIELFSAFDYTISEWEGSEQRSVLSDIVESGNFIDFSPEKSIDDVMHEAGQIHGKSDCKKMEQSYHYHFRGNDIAIRGREIVASDSKYTVLMLHPDDYRNFTVGYDTCCCQHYGSAGASCVRHLTQDPYAAQLVIVKNSQMKDNEWYIGPAIAQAYVWTDESKSTIVLDNIEFRRTTEENFDHRVREFSDVLGAWAAAMPYDNVHIGTGCNQGVSGWGKKVTSCVAMPDTMHVMGYGGYSDYHSDARAIKTDGEVLLKQVGDMRDIHIVHTDLIPSMYDFLSDERVAFIAGADMSVTEKKAFAEKFLSDQTPDVQREAFEIDPKSIKYIEYPIDELQEKVAVFHKELIPFIHHPSDAMTNVLITNDPYSILTIESPSRENWIAALKGDGLLLGKCPYREDEEVYLAAVKQNGLAIKYIASPSYEVQKEAVEQNINAFSFIRTPDRAVLFETAHKDASLLSNVAYLPDDIKNDLAAEVPASVLYMTNVPYEAYMSAISQDGMLIRLIKDPDEDLMHKAVEQNPFAIRYIRHPDHETYIKALSGNPKAVKYMRLSNEEKQSLLDEASFDRQER